MTTESYFETLALMLAIIGAVAGLVLAGAAAIEWFRRRRRGDR